MRKASTYEGICDKSAEDDLITVCAASGVKETGMQYRVLYGTREIGTVLLIEKRNSRTRIVRSTGDRLSRSSDETMET